jgi:regulator of nucleoside diphosphate kinase
MTLPPITIAKADRDRLVSIAATALRSERDTLAASTLLSQVGRAQVVVPGALPPQVVTVNSDVEIHDNITNTSRWVRLVYPEDATTDPNMVSVLSRFGAALVGLSVGDSIDWCTATGDRSCITVLRTGNNLSVRNPMQAE